MSSVVAASSAAVHRPYVCAVLEGELEWDGIAWSLSGRWQLPRSAANSAESDFKWRSLGKASDECPPSGLYEGSFSMCTARGPEGHREHALELAFTRTSRRGLRLSRGGLRVTGSGTNEFGSFLVVGAVDPTGRFKLKKIAGGAAPARGGVTRRGRPRRLSLQRGRSASQGVAASQFDLRKMSGRTMLSRGSARGPGRPRRLGVAQQYAQRACEASGVFCGPQWSQGARQLMWRLQTLPQAHWFLHPVPDDFCCLEGARIVRYHDVIKAPMDLTTMESCLEAKHFLSLSEFAEAGRLIFSNARMFNRPDDPCYDDAESVSAHFEREILNLATSQQAPLTDEAAAARPAAQPGTLTRARQAPSVSSEENEATRDSGAKEVSARQVLQFVQTGMLTPTRKVAVLSGEATDVARGARSQEATARAVVQRRMLTRARLVVALPDEIIETAHGASAQEAERRPGTQLGMVTRARHAAASTSDATNAARGVGGIDIEARPVIHRRMRKLRRQVLSDDSSEATRSVVGQEAAWSPVTQSGMLTRARHAAAVSGEATEAARGSGDREVEASTAVQRRMRKRRQYVFSENFSEAERDAVGQVAPLRPVTQQGVVTSTGEAAALSSEEPEAACGAWAQEAELQPGTQPGMLTDPTQAAALTSDATEAACGACAQEAEARPAWQQTVPKRGRKKAVMTDEPARGAGGQEAKAPLAQLSMPKHACLLKRLAVASTSESQGVPRVCPTNAFEVQSPQLGARRRSSEAAAERSSPSVERGSQKRRLTTKSPGGQARCAQELCNQVERAVATLGSARLPPTSATEESSLRPLLKPQHSFAEAAALPTAKEMATVPMGKKDLRALLEMNGLRVEGCVEISELEALWGRYSGYCNRPLQVLQRLCAAQGCRTAALLSSEDCARFLASPSSSSKASVAPPRVAAHTIAAASTAPAASTVAAAPAAPVASTAPAAAAAAPPLGSASPWYVREEVAATLPAALSERSLEASRIAGLSRGRFPTEAAWGFAVLALEPRSCDEAAVQRAYRLAMRRLHPDRGAKGAPAEDRCAGDAMEAARAAKIACQRGLSRRLPPSVPRSLRAMVLCATPGYRKFRLEWIPPQPCEAAPVSRYIVGVVDPAFGRALKVATLEPDYSQEAGRFVPIEELASYLFVEEEMAKMPAVWRQDSFIAQVAAANDAGQSQWVTVQVPLIVGIAMTQR